MLAFFSGNDDLVGSLQELRDKRKKAAQYLLCGFLTGSLKESWEDQAAGCKTLRSPISSSIVMLRF